VLTIYEFPGFPNPARIRIALGEKNAVHQVSFITVNVLAGEHREAAYQAKNPSGTVPAMELDDGTVISECTAITEYIDNTFDGPSLTGRSAKERAVIHMMQRRAEVRVLDAFAAYYHHATPGFGPELELYQNADWGQRQREVAVGGMRYFDVVLGRTPYVAGEQFSMADITLYCGLAYADFTKTDIPAECKNLLAWRAKVATRPSVQG
jgi:glutathione S-transferase